MSRRSLAFTLTIMLVEHMTLYAGHSVWAADRGQPVQEYDLARGAGQKRSECIGLVLIGPNISQADLETTRTDSYDAHITIRGTRDSIVCDAILHPAMQSFLRRSSVQFHGGATVPLEQLFHSLLEAGKQPRVPQSAASMPMNLLPLHPLHAVVVYQGTAVRPDPDPLDTPQGIIDITVEKTEGPVTLLLMSYDPVDWRVSLAPGGRVGSVILRGYHRQTIRGLATTVPINLLSFEDDQWERIFPRTLVTSRDGLLDFDAYVQSLFGVKPVTVQSMYTGRSILIDGKTTLEFQAPSEQPITQSVVFTSGSESSARFHGRTMISADRLTVGYAVSGTSTESIASVPHSKGKWYAEFIVHAGSGNGAPYTWTDLGIRSTANEHGGLTSHDGQLAYGVKRFLKHSGGLRDGDVIGLAIDVTQGHLYVRHNATWVGGPPENGNPLIRITQDREYVVAVDVGAPSQDYSKTDTWTGNFGATPFRHPLPQGFEPYEGRRQK